MAININNQAGPSASRHALEPQTVSRDAAHGGKTRRPDAGTSDILALSASFQAKVKSLDLLREQPPKEENTAIDGELKRMGDMLARMKALSVQAKSIPMNPGQKEQLSSEFYHLKNEIQRYSNATRQKGISIPYDPNQDAAQIGHEGQATTSWVQNIELEHQQSVDAAIESLDQTIEQVSNRKRLLYGIQDRLTAAFTALASQDTRSTGDTKAIAGPSQAQSAAAQIARTLAQNPHEAYTAQAQLQAHSANRLLA